MATKNPFAFKLRKPRNFHRVGQYSVTPHSIGLLLGNASREDLLQLISDFANGFYTPRDLYLDVEQHIWKDLDRIKQEA